VKSTGLGPDVSSLLLIYRNENIRHAHWLISHRFLGKYLGANTGKGSLKTECRLISDSTTEDYIQVCCNYQPCNVPESLLLKAGNNSAPSFHSH
jgi:hypothetical protein